MSLPAGHRLGQYEILAPLGSGGMGEVYRARDTRLKREIALKILPPALANDPERRERFTREAQVVAALNHPNIVTIHSVEEVDGVPFLTMELVEGQPLSDLVRPGGQTAEELLGIALPLVDALSAAHQRGVTHRDLKPGNVMIGHDGRLKVLDFGLARWHGPDSPDATALTTRFSTGEGRILGTAAYMSPEQAEGKPLDHRTDIFSTGVLLFELATGQRPFVGGSSLSILSSILKDTPPLVTAHNPRLPSDLARIINRCLEKDPDDRYQSTRDLRYELRQLQQGTITESRPLPGVHIHRRWPRSRIAAMAAVIGILAVSAAGIWMWRLWRTGSDRQAPMTVTVSPLTTQPGVEAFPSLSPDGKWVVYSSAAAGNADIYLQSATGQVPINLTKDSMLDDTQPALSPDGERIAFRSERDGGGLFVMGRTGESPRRLTDRGFNPAWSPDGRALVYATMSFVEPLSRVGNRSELWVVDIASGMTRRLAEPDAVQPSWSPHGHRVAYWGIPLGGSQRDLWTIPVTGGPAVRVTDDAAVDWNPVWAPDGGALFFASDRGGAMNLWRVAIDETSGRVRGEPVPITAPAQNVGEFSVSGDGRRLAYAAVQESSNLWSIAFDPVAGRAIGDARPLTSGSNRYSSVTVSPDGRRLAFTSLGRQEDLVVSRADGSELRQLTNDAAKDRSPAWAPDGTRIAFYSDRGGKYEVWTIRPDGSDLRQLTRTTATTGDPIWSPDGSRMIVSDSSGAVLLIDPSKPWTDQQPEVLPRWEGEGTFSAWRWSPDGRRLAGNVGPTPRDGIVVFDLERRVYRRILEVGQRPVWLRDSARMLFSAGSDIRIVDLRTGKAQVVMQIGNAPAAFGGGFDLSGDNRTLYFRRYVREADVWVADIKPGAE